MLLERFSITYRMVLMLLLMLLLFGEMTWFSKANIDSSRDIGTKAAANLMVQGQKDKIKVATHSMAVSLGALLAGIDTQVAKVAAVRKAVDQIRFEKDKSGYFFVYRNTTNIALPPDKELQGKDLKDIEAKKDFGSTKEVYLVRDLRDQARQGGGFVQYIWPKPGAGDQPKLSYAEMIPGTDMWIGTGVYLDNVAAGTKAIREHIDSVVGGKVLHMYVLSGLIFLGLIVLGAVITRGIVRPLKKVTAELRQGAGQVTSASGQVSASSQELAEGSSEQAAAIEEISSALEEMASMTRHNTDNTGRADKLMQTARQVVGQANASMADLTCSMQEISQASEETSKIIKTIDEIAFQTNLLALNAAVEAARAGEAGAGFAVVADEVRNLALRAAEAAQNTSGLIETNAQKINGGEDLVARTNEAFAQVSESVSKVGELVAEIAAASSEQAQGIEQINKSVGAMDAVVQKNAASAEESAAAAEEMNAQAEQMKGMVGALGQIVQGGRAGHPVDSGRMNPLSALHPVSKKRSAIAPRGPAVKAWQALPAAHSNSEDF